MRENPNVHESRTVDKHYEGEPAGNGRVWRRINDSWVTGVKQSISVFALNAAEVPQEQEEEKKEEEWQEFLWEKLPNFKDVEPEQDENILYQTKRRAVVRHDEKKEERPNRAGPSGRRLSDSTARVRRVESSESSDKEGAAAARLADQRRKRRRRNRRAACQFISTISSVEGGSKSDSKEGDASRTASDNSFVVGDDIFD